jgi:uncharacterized membrane protein (UPF0127 family)
VNANGSVYVYNKTRESLIGTEVAVADTYWSRLVGLLGKTRSWVRPGRGLWIVPSRGVHTIGMLFPIDLIYLDRSRQVIHIEEHVRPFGISKVCLKAESVLELPTHTIFRSRTQLGDTLEISKLPPPGESALSSASRNGDTHPISARAILK